MLSKTSILALLATTASAAALPADSASGTWVWHVTGATSTCTDGTCQYSFSVSAPTGPTGEPAFSGTGCSGSSSQGGFKSCSSVSGDVAGDVLGQEVNVGTDSSELDVRFTYEKDGLKYRYTSRKQIKNGAAAVDFDISPSEIIVVQG